MKLVQALAFQIGSTVSATELAFWRTQQKKEVDLIEIEDGVMTGYEIKWKKGKRIGAPASFTAAYSDAHFECITPSDLMGFLM